MKKYLLVVALIGCMDEKAAEEELLDDEAAKEDSHRRPTDHGAIGFGERASSVLTDDERYHAWTFELHGDARVDMTTSYAVLGQRRTDTVLYLYKEGPTGWGAYIARNDDYGNTTYSKLVRDLGAGRYRVLVKGHQASTRGKFSLLVGCDGGGCAPGCLFGEVYHDIETNPSLSVIGELQITAANLDTLSAADQAKLVRAVHQSSHTDVMTPAEALSRVDQMEMNVTFVAEPAARRSFVAFEYGAGDNSYGAIFERRGDAMVTSIQDGDLYECTVQRETCLLPEDWATMRNDPAFVRTAAKVVTAANQLDALEAQQALAAFKDSYDDVTTVADGLSRVDDNRINVQTFQHTSGQSLTVVEYGAGDTSVGAIYYAGQTVRAGSINDLFIEACTFFAP